MRIRPEELNALLKNVEKPARYIGGEVGSMPKEEAALRWALAFPDIYETAESYLGLKILYKAINSAKEYAAERVYAPWPDLIQAIKQAKLPLWSLETLRPLNEFDIVGFSLPHEMCYTTVLTMLQLGNIPLNPIERGPDMPLVVAGGLQAFNAEPLAPFMDAFLLGDGEELNLEVSDYVLKAKRAGLTRSEIINGLAAIKGVYLPGAMIPHYSGLNVASWTDSTGAPIKTPFIKARRLNDLSKAPLPASIIPWARPVHDRVTVEIQRGCDHGCRFCAAGMLYRPVRHRQVEEILERAQIGVKESGQEEIGLLSLSAADHPQIEEIITNLTAWGRQQGIAVSLPSLRLESLRPKVARAIASSGRRTGFTMAPEAATERMRRVINKGNTEEELFKAVKSAIDAGWQRLKFYFMLGLPTERDEDILAIAELVKKVLRSTKKRLAIEISCAAFIPKAHTPFQYAAQVTGAELDRRFKLLREAIKPMREVRLSYSQGSQALLEGLFSRGDRRQAATLLTALKNGAYLDNWTEHFNWPAWEKALSAWPEDTPELMAYLGERDLDKALPWDHLHSAVPTGYLRKEYKKALVAEGTRGGLCEKWQREMLKRDKAEEESNEAEEIPVADPYKQIDGEAIAYLVRLRYAKRGRAALLGHLETVTHLTQAMRRAALPLTMSGGHHPSPRLGFGPALSLGVMSEAELVDIGLREHLSAEEIIARLKKTLPEDLVPLAVWPLEPGDSPACEAVAKVRYQLTLSAEVDLERLEAAIAKVLAAPALGVQIMRKGKTRTIDARIFINSLNLQDNILTYTMNNYRDSGLRMGEMLAIIGLTPSAVLLSKKVDVAISSQGRPVAQATPEDLPIALDLSGINDGQ